MQFAYYGARLLQLGKNRTNLPFSALREDERALIHKTMLLNITPDFFPLECNPLVKTTYFYCSFDLSALNSESLSFFHNAIY